MKVWVDGWAWLPVSELTEVQKNWLTDRLTLVQVVSKEYQNRADPAIVNCFIHDKERGLLGIPREFFFEKLTRSHEVEYRVVDGDPWPTRKDPEATDGVIPTWAAYRPDDPTLLTFYDTANDKPCELINEQPTALAMAISHLNSRPAAGGIIQAPTGWGKTVWALSLIREMRLKTAVLVHRKFLMDQWRKRIAQFLPDAKVGIIFGDKWDVEDKHIVLVMIETLASWVKRGSVRPELAGMFGLVVSDEVHRAGAPTWQASIPLFYAAKRIGISARPKRSDGLDKAFQYHIGPKIFTGQQLRLLPKIRRVWTSFRIRNDRLNQTLISKEMVTKLMSTNVSYNEQVVTQIKLALEAGRKILVYSASLEHLRRMKSELDNTWNGRPMKTDFFIGGMSEEDLDEAATADVIFATYQMALDSLDIPALDTVVLASPIRNPEQPVGRILRPFAGKKDPVVVDIRADEIAVCKDYAESRDRTYIRLYEKK